MNKILIYGHYRSNNLGDNYMIYHINEYLKNKDIVPVYFKGYEASYFNIEEVKEYYYPGCKKGKIDLKNLIKILKWYFNKESISQFSAIIFMGGGYVNDNFNLKTMFIINILVKKFKRHHKKIYFTGQSVGPATTAKARKYLKKIYQSADYISVRETHSLAALKDLGIESKLIGDDAYLTDDMNYNPDKKHRCIFNFKNFKGYDQYKDSYFEFLLKLSNNLDYEVVIISTKSETTSNEYKINYELYEFLKTQGSNVLFKVESNMDSFIELFKSSSLVVSTAYHCIVLGLMFGCNVYSAYLGDYYKMKIQGILEWYGLNEDHCIDLKILNQRQDDFIYDIIHDSTNQPYIKEKSEEIEKLVKSQWDKIINDITS